VADVAPVSAILKAAAAGSWGPVVSGPTLPRSPTAAFLAGRYDHVPLLQGSNHDEGRLFVGLGFDLLGHPITKKQYPELVTAQFGAKGAQAILAKYPLSACRSPDLAYSAVLTDSTFSYPALGADLLAAGSGGIPFFDSVPPFKPAQRALSNLFVGYWTSFAATGNPNHRGAPRWPRFLSRMQRLQELIPSATAPETGAKFGAFHNCAFWLALEAGR
jgi:para-nitrobenzyl esterase